jgi:hypothetical protein
MWSYTVNLTKTETSSFQDYGVSKNYCTFTL